MILILKAIIIGIVEGITEFLPISSTGHMVLIGNLINFNQQYGNFPKYFEIVIQLGAILAIVVLYWNKIWNSLKNLMPGKWGFKMWTNIIIAVIPSAIVGLKFDNKIEGKLLYPIPVAAALLVGGILMILIENKFRGKYKTKSMDDVSLKQAIFIGCFQCLALWPGMSRSASTIMGAWICGLSSPAAAEFSFFLAIPTMVGACGLKVFKGGVLTPNEVIALGVGFIVAFIVALVVVEKFVNFLKRRKMRIFAVYRIFVGIILLILAALSIIK